MHSRREPWRPAVGLARTSGPTAVGGDVTAATLHVVTSDARRGAETFAVDLVTALVDSGQCAEVVALSPSGMGEVHDLPVLGRTRRSGSTLRRLRQSARRVDVVVAHGSATLEACSLGLAGTEVPFVYRTIGDPSYWVKSTWRRRGIGWMLRRAARNVVLWPVAGRALASLYGIPSDRIEVIPNAVPTSRFGLKDETVRHRARQRLGLPEEGPCLAFVGALSIEKDVATLLRALPSLRGTHLVVAGDGPEGPSLRLLAEDLAPRRVHWLGTVSDPLDVYTAADVHVLPSLSEGMPAVVVEAGLVGTPTVASAVGAVPEMIDDGDTGFLVPPGDPTILAAAITEALDCADHVGRRARTAFQERYDITTVASQWAKVIDEVAR
jgi:glycosyltransferase involved in cell wall biosynthesis